MRAPFASTLIAEIAPEMGITVELEPEFGFAGEIIFSNGKRHLFRNTNFNVNPAGSTEIAKDKAYTNYFLRKHGFPVPDGKTFFSERLRQNLSAEKQRGVDAAVVYAREIGFPVFVKPNNLSQGAFVTKAYEEEDLVQTAAEIFKRTDVMLVERPCPGRDYRVVVLGQKIISAYERRALAVFGTGALSVSQLLAVSKDRLHQYGRPNSEIDLDDPRIDVKLRSIGITRDYIPNDGEKVNLLDNANLSTGGTSVDVTEHIHADFVQLSISATKRMGLRLAGVDIICEDLSSSSGSQIWNIIEINAAPGLDNYASMGSVQAERVRYLYSEILRYLATHDA